MTIDFDRPVFLVLLPVVWALLWFGQRGSLAQWTRPQAMVCGAVRVLIATLLVAALAGPRRVSAVSEPAVVFLRDVSASVEPESSRRVAEQFAKASEGREGRSAEFDFAARAVVVRGFRESERHAVAPDVAATDISGALAVAAASLPSDRPGRIVLATDGVSTAGGDPLTSPAVGEGIEIDVLPIDRNRQPDAAVAKVGVPRAVREGEVIDVSARVVATVPLPGSTVRLYQNDLLVGETQTDLKAGANDITFPNIRADGRMAVYEVEVAAPGDTVSQNNRRKVAVTHAGRARVLIVDGNPVQSEPLAAALRESAMQVEVRPPRGFPDTLEDIEPFDLVVFCDAPAAGFTGSQLALLERWVRDFGGGFLMVGGEESFGAGGWFQTPVATSLPLGIERQERQETPVVALLVILDRSGSMSAPAGTQTKMSLANEGAVLALDVLQSKDLFGVFAVDTRAQEVLPLARITDRQAAARRISAITAGGGGIYVYTSLAEALPRMRAAPARIKHIILFSDAADAEEKTAGEFGGPASGSGTSAMDLAAALLASRVTLSVVALGTEQDRDTNFLRQLAEQGGGRFYLTADATTLPRLFTMETMRATESSLREDAFVPVPTGNQDFLRGIDWAKAPFLLGYNIANVKPGAEVILRTEGGDPLLAEWRYGLGRTAAFASDAKSRWASEWLAWPGYQKFWAQLARHLARPAGRDDLLVTAREAFGTLTLDVDAVTAAGTFRNNLSVKASIASPGESDRTVELAQVAPGHYRASVPPPVAGPAIISVSDGTGQPVNMGWTPTYPAEFLPDPADQKTLSALASATGGRESPEDYFRPAVVPRVVRSSLAPWLLACAVVLWPVDIWLRRRAWMGLPA